MATQTVLDLPAITYVDEGDVCYLIRGVGAGRDKQINVEDGLIPKLLTFTTSSSINLASYNGDLTIYGTGSIALTFTGTLRDGKQLIIMNKGTGTISCAGTITASLRQYESLTGISDSSTMAVTRNATNDTSGNLLAYGNILGSGHTYVDGVIKSGTIGTNGSLQAARASDGLTIGTFYTDGTDAFLKSTGALKLQSGSTDSVIINTAGQLLIGTSVAPSATGFKQVLYSDSFNSLMSFQTASTGTGAANGSYVGYSDTNGLALFNYENTGISLGTASIIRATISNTGIFNARFGAIFDSTVDINGALTTKAITLASGSNLIVGTGTSTFGGDATFNSTVDINGALTTKAITLDSGSNLVVTSGTSSLNGNVDITGYNYVDGVIKSGTIGTNGYIQVARSSDGDAIGTFYTDGDNVLLRNTSGTGSLVFKTNSTEQMRLNTAGQLLIGTVVAPSNTGFKQVLYSTSNISLMSFQTLATGTSDGNGAYVGYSDTNGLSLFNYENTGMLFGTNSTERMTISNTGVLTQEGSAVFNSTVDINGNTTVDGTLTTSDELTIDASATKASMRMQTSLTGSGTSDGVQISYDGISGLVFNNQESTPISFYTVGVERMSISQYGAVTFASISAFNASATFSSSVYMDGDVALNGTVHINGALTTKDITVESGSELTVTSGITRLTGGLIGKDVINFPDVYTSTTALASNVYINSGGQLYRCSSSRKTKENERPLEVDTAKVYDIEVVTFDMKNTGETGHGPIAEDIAEVEPNFATYDINNEPEAIHTNTVLYALLEEVKKLKSRIEFLEGGI